MAEIGAIGPRFLELEGTYNLRDVGGYPAREGTVRWSSLYRSDALHRLSDAGRDALAALGVRTIVDLRDPREIEHAPSRTDGLGIETVHVPIFGGAAPRSASDGVSLERMYEHIVEERSRPLADAVAAIADADGPTLVHCTAGKDRTGLVIALTLLAVGVDRDTVIADYAHTQQRLAGEWLETMIERMRLLGVPETPRTREVWGASPPDLLERVLARIDQGWGGAVEYLRASEVTDAQLESLRAKLVDRGSSTAPDAG